MNFKCGLFLVLSIVSLGACFGQTKMEVTAVLDDSTHIFKIQQKIIYENSSSESLSEIYLNDWANSFKDKSTPLAKRFAEEYIRRFHFAKPEERGYTKIYSLTNGKQEPQQWARPVDAPDLIKIYLEQPLLPGEKKEINILYEIKIPSEKFTRFGYDDDGNYKLKYWYITPAVYDKGWQIYSDKNLGDQYTPPIDLTIRLSTRPYLYVASSLKRERLVTEDIYKTTILSGKNRISSELYLTRKYRFEVFSFNDLEVLTNLEDDGLPPTVKAAVLKRITDFLEERLGPYPHEAIMVTRDNYLNNPAYGFIQLPKFIRPFPDGFPYDIKQLKTLTNQYLKNTLLLNPREEQWVYDAIQISLMRDYVDTYYPKMKVLGNLANVIGIRWFHAADLEFNDQYPFLYLHMARLNLDQPLSTAQDSLVKFNLNIANAYKAGAGMKYLEEFLGSGAVKKSISEFYQDNVLKPTSEEEFKKVLKRNAQKDISWFFEDYVETNNKIDFRFGNLKRSQDSLTVTIKNKTETNTPVSLYGLNDGKIVYKEWVENVGESKMVTIPRDSIERLALNYEAVIPELNQRDNYKGVTTILDKPIQFRLLQDVEDPKYYQLFFMPEFSYNLYDGIAIGPKIYNKTLLARNFNFNFSPKYGFNSETIVGSGSVSNTHFYDDQDIFAVTYGIGGNRFSFGYDLFYEKFTPYLGFFFRNSYLRDNERQSLIIRNVNVQQDLDPLNPAEQPEYNVFNVSYNFSDTNLVEYISGGLDYELSKNFSKVALELEYRKLFKNNRQINLRFFGGTFLFNDEQDNDYFSFALDRPTDYLFDYNYYGRSQSSGLFSQQIIPAEGGFKSQLQPEFANQWLTSVNASTTIWKWIFAYGDLGLVKNKNFNAHFLYDSGIRVSLVQDYFELYFPVYSNLGWEIAQENYDQKIRFIVTLDVGTLLKLFSREWY